MHVLVQEKCGTYLSFFFHMIYLFFIFSITLFTEFYRLIFRYYITHYLGVDFLSFMESGDLEGAKSAGENHGFQKLPDINSKPTF